MNCPNLAMSRVVMYIPHPPQGVPLGETELSTDTIPILSKSLPFRKSIRPMPLLRDTMHESMYVAMES